MSSQQKPMPLDIATPAGPSPILQPTLRSLNPAKWFWRSESGAVSAEWIVLSGLMFAFVTLVVSSISEAIAAKDIPL